jgi:hypothetical protein
MRATVAFLVAVAVVCADVRLVQGRPRAIQGADGVWKNEPYVNPPKDYDPE